MARQPLRIARGTNAQVQVYVGGLAEPVLNTETRRVHIQDGATPGGVPMAKVADLDDKVTAAGGDVSATTAKIFATAEPRSVAEFFFRLPHVQDYKAVGDGIAEDAARINEGIIAGANNGAPGLRLGAKHKVSTTLVCAVPNMTIYGNGGNVSHDTGVAATNSGTVVTWAGAAGGTVCRFTSPEGGSGFQKLSGGGLESVHFQGGGTQLEVLSRNTGVYRRLMFHTPTITGLHVNVVAALGEARDPQRNLFEMIQHRAVSSTGAAMILDGDDIANTSFNRFVDWSSVFQDGDAYVVKNTDNNWFQGLQANKATPAGLGKDVVLHGSNTSEARTARGNIFFVLSADDVSNPGTETYVYPARGNYILFDAGNGTKDPIVGTGVDITWEFINGRVARQYHDRLAATGSNQLAIDYMKALHAAGDRNPLTVISDPNGRGLVIRRYDIECAWIMRALATGQLDLSPIATPSGGTGLVRVPGLEFGLDGPRIIRSTARPTVAAPDGSICLSSIGPYSRVDGAWRRTSPSRHPGYISGKFYTPRDVVFAPTPLASAADTIYVFPVPVDTLVTVSALAARISTAVAGTAMLAGIYANSAGRPSTVLARTATPIAGDVATTATAALTSNTVLEPGIYWFAALPNGAIQPRTLSTLTSHGMAAMIGSGTGANVINGTVAALSSAQTYVGGLPDDLTGRVWSDVLTAVAPVIAFTVA